jgi:hypothetical protein
MERKKLKELLDGCRRLVDKAVQQTALPRKRFAIQELGHQDQPLIRPDLSCAKPNQKSGVQRHILFYPKYFIKFHEIKGQSIIDRYLGGRACKKPSESLEVPDAAIVK